MRMGMKILAVLLVILLLEIPTILLHNKISDLEARLSKMEDAARQMPETTEQTVPETTQPVPEETLPPETVPEETKQPRATIDQIPQYFQNDYPDVPYGTDTLDRSGSNMVALAMVATYMTDHEFYPDQISDYLAHFIGGNYQRLEYGSDLLQLTWKRAANIDEALAGVRSGKVAIFMQNKNSIFTWKDHFIVVTGVNEDGKYMVLDTNRDHYEKDKLKDAYENGFSQKQLLIGYSCAWLYDKSAMPEEPFIYEPEGPEQVSRYGDLKLTEEEKLMIAKLICVEAGGEPFDGQQAVAEVILNRLASGKFQSSVRNIIYADNQFEAAPVLDDGKPEYTQLKAVEQALYGPYVLPIDVVFYAKYKINDNFWGKIGEHYFCYSY